jgi:hypothetical protein
MPFTDGQYLQTSAREIEMENMGQDTETSAQAYQTWSTNPTAKGAITMLQNHPELAPVYKAREQILQGNAEDPNGPQIDIRRFDAAIIEHLSAKPGWEQKMRMEWGSDVDGAEPQR